MARLMKPQDTLSQKDEAEKRRTIHYYKGTRTGHLLATWRIHNVFHATLLQPYKENEVYGANFPEPPPELLEGEEVYKIETILNH